MEWDINPNLLRTELTATPFEIRDGAIDIPDGPGLGWAPPAGECGRMLCRWAAAFGEP